MERHLARIYELQLGPQVPSLESCFTLGPFLSTTYHGQKWNWNKILSLSNFWWELTISGLSLCRKFLYLCHKKKYGHDSFLLFLLHLFYLFIFFDKNVCCWPDGGVEILQWSLSALYWGYNDVSSTRKISLPANIVLCLHTWLPRVILTRNCQFSHHYWCHYIHIHTIYPPAGNNNHTKEKGERVSFIWRRKVHLNLLSNLVD